jgi:methyl-accepting chemotaxis protein
MSKISKESLEFKYFVFVIALLIGGVLWSVIVSFSAVSLEKIYGRTFHFIFWTTVLSIIGIAVIALLFWFIARRLVIRHLKRIERAAQSLAEGDLTFRIDIRADDEIGRISRAMNESVLSLGDIFQRVKNGSKRATAVAEKVDGEFRNISDSTKLETEAIANIATSLEQMNSAAGEISENTDRLAVSTEEKAASMEQIVTSIGQVANSAEELSQVVDTTSVSIEELSATIREVAYKAEELAAASEETLAATEEISSSIKEVDQSAKQSAQLSEKVKNEASTLGITSVAKTIEGIQNIKNSFDNTATSIKKLGMRSDEIGKILNVIDEVTDQTTLLALNAAILAAQAGEHGKGFSVVADEIKDLAERTSFSTHEIAGLIQSVQQEVRDAVIAMDEGLRSVEEGLTVAQDAAGALNKIVESSKTSAEMALSIERSTAEQAKTTRLVSESMEKVKNMVAQIAKATAEQSKGALLITHATEKIRDVSNHVKTATHEQLISARHISEAMELVSEKSLQIAKAVSEQKAGANQIFTSIEKIKDMPKHNMDRMFGIHQSLQGLLKNTDLLTSELKKIQLPGEGATGKSDMASIRFGIEPAGGRSPVEIQEKFKPLADYLTKKIGKKVTLKVVSDYEGILRDIDQGVTQFCFLSPVTYVLANKKYGAQVLVKTLTEGKSSYRSAIIAKAAKGIHSTGDIRGQRFAFGNPHSLSSYIAPRNMLLDAGIDLKDLLHYEYLGSHEAVADAVQNGNCDAGGIAERVAGTLKDKDIRVIQYSEDLPGFCICCSRTMPQEMQLTLADALTALKETTPEGSLVLHAVYKRCSGFEKADDNEFAPVRTMMKRLDMPS